MTLSFTFVARLAIIANMLPEAVAALLDRIIQFKSERNARARNLFSDFVEPIWSDFTRVHEAYLARLRQYLDLVDSANFELNQFHPVFAAIRRDTAFTLADRTYLVQVSNNSGTQPMPHELSGLQHVETFMADIYDYLHSAIEIARLLEPRAYAGSERLDDRSYDDATRQPVRGAANIIGAAIHRALLLVLASDFDADFKRRLARDVVHGIASEVQQRFLSVKRHYNMARVAALS